MLLLLSAPKTRLQWFSSTRKQVPSSTFLCKALSNCPLGRECLKKPNHRYGHTVHTQDTTKQTDGLYLKPRCCFCCILIPYIKVLMLFHAMLFQEIWFDRQCRLKRLWLIVCCQLIVWCRSECFGGFTLKENLPQELGLYYQVLGYHFDIWLLKNKQTKTQPNINKKEEGIRKM